MNDAEIMELVDEVEGANAPCNRRRTPSKSPNVTPPSPPAYREGDIVSGWDRDGTSPAKVDKILFVPSYPYYDLRVLPITEGGKPSRRHRYAYNVLDVTPYEGGE